MTARAPRPHELVLAGILLSDYADRLSCDGCNDWSFPADWSEDQKVSFVRGFYAWNGSPEDFNPQRLILGNTSVARYLAAMLSAPVTPSRSTPAGLDAEQHTKFVAWAATKPKSQAADGAQFEFSYIPTGIGTVVRVTCHITGDVLDLTDYAGW